MRACCAFLLRRCSIGFFALGDMHALAAHANEFLALIAPEPLYYTEKLWQDSRGRLGAPGSPFAARPSVRYTGSAAGIGRREFNTKHLDEE